MQRSAQRVAAKPRSQKTAVEGVARAGRVDDAHGRRGGADVVAAAHEPAACRTELDDNVTGRVAPPVDRGADAPLSRVEADVVACHAQVTYGRRQRAEVRVAHERRIPSKIPRRRDAARAQRLDDANPWTAGRWKKREV